MRNGTTFPKAKQIKPQSSGSETPPVDEAMPATLFLALQCCQCSTMQVKQQKKSSNQWVCVICNLKQSVRKVFAQGFEAKELRFFVQSFNMSRKSLQDEDDDAAAAASTLSDIHVGFQVDTDTPAAWRKRRTDWSEFLDLDPPTHCRISPEQGRGNEGIDTKFVTEIPKDMFKKPRLNKYSIGGGPSLHTGPREEDGNELYKPIFSRRTNKQEQCSVNTLKCAETASERQNDSKQRNLVPGGVSKFASKWNAYLTQEEEEEANRALPQLGRREDLEDDDDVREWRRAVLGISMAGRTVDDEVHPDFK